MSHLDEGIEPELAPLASALIEPWNEKMAVAKDPEGQLDPVQVINALIDQNQKLILAIARIERAVNREAGTVVTDK